MLSLLICPVGHKSKRGVQGDEIRGELLKKRIEAVMKDPLRHSDAKNI